MNLAIIREIIDQGIKDLQNIVNASSKNPIQNYDSLRASCIVIDNEALIASFTAMQQAIDSGTNQEQIQEEIKEQFASLMRERRETTQQTFLCPLGNPDLFSNALCIKLFHQLYPDASVATYLNVFAPDVEQVLELDVVREKDQLEQSVRGPSLLKIRIVPKLSLVQEVASAAQDINQFIIIKDIAFSFVHALEGNAPIFTQNYQILSNHYPDFYHQLKKYQPDFCSIYEKIEEIENKGLTLAERMQRLHQALILAGTKITGGEEADWRVSLPLIAFNEYLESLPEEVEQQVLALASSSGTNTLGFIMEQLRENPHQCVETAAEWVSNILTNSKNKEQLEKPSLLEDKSKYIQAVNRLGQENNGQSKVIAYLMPPPRYAEKAIGAIEIQGSNEIGLMLQNFDAQFYSLFKTKIKTEDVKQLIRILVWLDETQSTAFCTIFNDELKQIVQKSNIFSQLFAPLSVQRAAVYAALECELPSIIQDGYDFACVLKDLTPDQRTAVYESFKNKLRDIIKNSNDFAYVLQYLTPIQRMAVFAVFKDEIRNIIKDSNAFVTVFQFLTPNQRTIVYEDFKDELWTIIQDSRDFAMVLQPLTPDQRTAIYEDFKDKLRTIIQNNLDFAVVLQYLTPDQCTTICRVIKERFIEVIPNSNDFEFVLQDLTSDQRMAVYNIFKDELPKIINNSNDFAKVTALFSGNDLRKIRQELHKKSIERRLNEISTNNSSRFFKVFNATRSLATFLYDKLNRTPSPRTRP